MSALSGGRRRGRRPFSAQATTETAFEADPPVGSGGEGRAVEAAERRLGTLFAGRFRLTDVLGVGGMGVVFAARDEKRRQRVALKLLRSGAKRRGTRRIRLRREGQVGQRLEHPAIVRALDAGDHEGEPYVVLEYVSGARSLRELQETLGRTEKVRVVRDAALALGHAHARGVVHRDVKPENVLLDGRGRVRVVDFGLATTHDWGRITREGCCLGTPLFMAPETITAGEYGPQVDVWALGVTLYWLLTARHPFEAQSVTQLAQQILTTRPVPPRRYDPRVPRRVERACLRALERDPRRRHRDGAALAVELDRWLLGEWARQATAGAEGGGAGRPGPGLELELRSRLLAALLWIAGGALAATVVLEWL
jgi:serine/threonine-protein kinase